MKMRPSLKPLLRHKRATEGVISLLPQNPVSPSTRCSNQCTRLGIKDCSSTAADGALRPGLGNS